MGITLWLVLGMTLLVLATQVFVMRSTDRLMRKWMALTDDLHQEIDRQWDLLDAVELKSVEVSHDR